MSFKQKIITPNTRPATPNAAQSDSTYRGDSSTSLLDKAKKSVLRAFNKKQDETVFHAIAAVPLGPVGIPVSQDHQGSSILASNVPGIHKTSTLHPAVTPDSLEVKSRVLQALPSSIQRPRLNIFFQNVAPPALTANLPPPGARFEDTAQLAYCGYLLRKCLSPSLAATSTLDAPLDPTLHALIEPYARSEDEASYIRCLIQRVVEEFAADRLKTTAVLSEVLLLVPSLEHEHYRKLLNCVIAEFETARLLDLDLLQSLVQLVESAASNYLESDDLVRILVVLRTRLQETHQQSTKYPYYLTWALSRLLDVMVEGKVKDLRRVVDQEPLSALFSQLKDSEDPYLKHQATYAFQGLMHVPNDETRRQCMLRHASNITMGLLGVTSVCKLDLGQLGDGVDHLYKAARDVYEVGTNAVSGAQSLIESGHGIWASVKGGIFSGGRQVWYTSLREAQQHIRNGRLQEFNNLVFEAPCCDHVDFQWGICRLLGEIALDPLWESSTRQHAIDFLAELYRNNMVQAPSENINRWILTILHQIVASRDIAIFDHAQLLLHGLEKAGDAVAVSPNPYPIQVHFSISASSTLLSRALAIPTIEYDLLRLKDRRLRGQENVIYIPPQAKPTLQSSDATLFPLKEKVIEFLADPGLVFLLLGDSGGGKSTFNLQLERTLWKTYTRGGPIPLHINLPSIDNPQQDMIAKQLRQLDFSDSQVMELKQTRDFIVICDGYDESQLSINLHTTNLFNQPGQWRVKMVVACRTQYLGSNFRNRFVPQGTSAYDRSASDLFQEAVIAPFSKEQIQRYVELYVPLEPRTWRTEDYMDRLTTIPNLMDLVKNPFLLSLALEALPGVTKDKKDLSTIKITRVRLYDTFVQHWLEVNQRRLERNNALPSVDRDILLQLVDAGFVSLGIEYSTNLALAIFDKQEGNPVVLYVQLSDTSTWKAEFFGSQPKARLLRESSPLTRTGNQFRFVHRSMLEYFLSRVIYNPARIDEREFGPQAETASSSTSLINAHDPLFRRNLVNEPSIIQFLSDRVKSSRHFEQELRGVVNRSKTDDNAIIAATNAITILVRAGVHFNSADLQGIRIPGADLSGGQFDFAQLQGADLTGVNLSRSWLRQVDLSGARLEGVRFGELPYLEVDDYIISCTYSPDGKLLALGMQSEGILVYDTSTWTITRSFPGFEVVRDIAFSPDGRRIVSGGLHGLVRMWDCNSGEEVLVMHGHTDQIYSVEFSPCGKQIASAGDDNTVRLWDSQTGESHFVLEGHTDGIRSVKYSPEGRQLVSGSLDGAIRFWDPETGELGTVLSPSHGRVYSFAYSPHGQWVASGHDGGEMQLWNSVTKEPGPTLRGHTNVITGICFSPNGQWVVSSSDDKTVRLWDASTGDLVSTLNDHNNYVSCVAFAPDGLQFASGGYDWRVRLWEMGSSWSRLDLRDGGRVKGLAYSSDGQSLISYDEHDIFRQWDTATGTSAPIPREIPQQKAVSSRTYAMDGRQSAVGCEDGSIQLLSLETGTPGPILEGHSSEVRRLVYSRCCRWIVSVDKSNAVRLWDLRDVEQQYVLINVDESLEGTVSDVAFSSTGDQLAVGTWKGFVRLYNPETRKLLAHRNMLDSYIMTLSFSPSDRQLAIGTNQGNIYLWHLQLEEPGVKLEGHNRGIWCIAYSPCGQWIASGSSDRTVGIWHRQMLGEVEGWSVVHYLNAFFAPVRIVAWSPMVPMELVSSCQLGSVRVWRMSHDDDRNVIVKMLWGTNLGTLCAEGLIFENVTGLSSVNQKLLVQRGAISPTVGAEPEEQK